VRLRIGANASSATVTFPAKQTQQVGEIAIHFRPPSRSVGWRAPLSVIFVSLMMRISSSITRATTRVMLRASRTLLADIQLKSSSRIWRRNKYGSTDTVGLEWRHRKKWVDLITRYNDNVEFYTSGKYNETQVRREFIDPFFKALGWDIDNSEGYSEAYKMSFTKIAIKIGGGHRAPDLFVSSWWHPKFFLEAKKKTVGRFIS